MTDSRTPPETAALLAGPVGGEWVRVDGGSHGGFAHCAICNTFHQQGWRYYVGIVAKLAVCNDCAGQVVK